MSRRDKIESLIRQWNAKPCKTCLEGPRREALKDRLMAERKPGEQVRCPDCGEQLIIVIDLSQI